MKYLTYLFSVSELMMVLSIRSTINKTMDAVNSIVVTSVTSNVILHILLLPLYKVSGQALKAVHLQIKRV